MALAANQSAVHWRVDNDDSHFNVYGGWCIAQGARPYADLWNNKPPGIWWLNALSVRLCGPGEASEVLIGTLAALVGMLAVIAVARTIYHRSLLVPAVLVAVVLLTDVRFDCGSDRNETVVVACETLTVLGYVRWRRRGRVGWLILGGLAAGAAPLFKQAGLAAAAACAAHLLWTQQRMVRHGNVRSWWRDIGQPWVVGGAALAVVPLVAVSVLAWQGLLAEAAFAAGRFNRAYFAVGDATYVHLGRAFAPYKPLLALLGQVLVVAAGGSLAGLLLSRRRAAGRTRAGVSVLWMWALLAFYLACVSPGRQQHHLMPILPVLALLMLVPLHVLVARRGLRAALVARPAGVVLVVVYGVVLATLATGNVRALEQCWNTKPHWYSLEGTRSAGFRAQAEAIAQHCAPEQRIYVWGWSPGTYRHAARLPTSRFATFEKLGQVGVHARFIFDGALADIQRDPPCVLLMSPLDYTRLGRGDDAAFAVWLRARYVIVATINGLHVLVPAAAAD